MDGELGVESQVGIGSDFWVRIPQTVIDPAPCGPYQGQVSREESLFVNRFTAPEGVVLVVDDHELNLRVIQGLLGPYQLEVHTARSGQEALEQVTQVWPDLIFMTWTGWRPPGASGRWGRRTPTLPWCPSWP